MIPLVHRIVATSLALVALVAGGVTIARAESGSPSAPVTKAEAVTFAQAVTLQASDLPGAKKYEVPTFEVAQDEREGAASWSRTLRCARPGIGVHSPVHLGGSFLLDAHWLVTSVVQVMATEAIAAAAVAAFASRRGHGCFARAVDVQITSENAPLGPYPVAATFVPLTSLLGAGAIGVHDLIRESFKGKHWFLHSDGAFFRVGAADIEFSVLGKTQFPAATEGRLLALLDSRAEAHKL